MMVSYELHVVYHVSRVISHHCLKQCHHLGSAVGSPQIAHGFARLRLTLVLNGS